jgi:hypothetical protein
LRVNVYAEEMTDRVQIISKTIDGQKFTGLRFYLELPATVNGEQHQGPFIHKPGDDDSAAVTFWGKQDLRTVLRVALAQLDQHYGDSKPIPYDRMYKLCDHYGADYNKTCAVLQGLIDRGYFTGS